MNHCRKCDSDYTQPGTCNCYAQIAKPPVVYPNLPTSLPTYPTVAPYNPYPWWGVQEPQRFGYPRITYTTTTAPVAS